MTQCNWSSPYQVQQLGADGKPVNGPDGKPVMQTVTSRLIAQGPTASQEIIKELGTNGGGFFNANSAHPFENPTPFTNFLELFCILAIPSAFTLHPGENDGLAAAWMGGVGGDGSLFLGCDYGVLGGGAGQSLA
jgi:potassium-transporting ATPase potassium-binding subunit